METQCCLIPDLEPKAGSEDELENAHLDKRIVSLEKELEAILDRFAHLGVH